MFRAAEDPERIVITRVQALRGDECVERDDALAVEEPLEVRLGDEPLAVIMRTPGHDDELAAGFLHGEGIIRSRDDVLDLRLWQDAGGQFAQNLVTVLLSDGAPAHADPRRQFYATSSCGVCGKGSIDAVLQLAPPLARRAAIAARVLYRLPDQLRAAQPVFARTGSLHGAALCDLNGTLLLAREDVGRHNAVDKLVGRSLLDGGLPLHERILFVSGRVSFEIVQKALMARIPVIAAVSAPSSLAVAVARQSNMSLVGFLRDGRLNIYC